MSNINWDYLALEKLLSEEISNELKDLNIYIYIISISESERLMLNKILLRYTI